jgi:hypothetical protein
MRRKIACLTALALGASIGVTAAPSAAACANPSVYLSLTGFPSEAGTARFYYAAENDTAAFTVRRLSHDCSFTVASVGYAVTHISTSDQDLEPLAGRVSGLRDPDHDGPPHSQVVSVPLKNDELAEDAVKKAWVELRDPEGGVLGTPSSAPLYVVDDDGPARVTFAESSYTHDEKMGRLDVPVFRGGDASAATTVSYSIEPGPAPAASPDQDLAGPTEGTLSFAAGQRLRMLSLDVKNDSTPEGDENLVVNLTGDAVTNPSSTTVTITDDAAVPAPTTRFHHPIQGKRYPYNDFLLREVHVFATDAGSGVARVQIALRRKLDSGACAWWNGEGFSRGLCSKHRWFKMRGGDDFGDEYLFLYRFPALKRTAGTNIKNYTAYSRAIDPNGIREAFFEKGRNRNTFKVTRRR